MNPISNIRSASSKTNISTSSAGSTDTENSANNWYKKYPRPTLANLKDFAKVHGIQVEDSVLQKWIDTQAAKIAKLEAEAIKATRGAVVKEKLSHETALAVGNTGAEFDAFIKAEQARWKPVISGGRVKGAKRPRLAAAQASECSSSPGMPGVRPST